MCWMVYSKWKPFTYDFVSMPQFDEDIDWFDAKMEWRRLMIILLVNNWIYMTRGWFENPTQVFRIEPDTFTY